MSAQPFAALPAWHGMDDDVEPGAPQPGEPRQMKCLLVDDSRFDRSLVRYSASRAGLDLEITDAQTLSEARETLNSDSFELILLDNALPDGKGVEFRAEIAASALNRNAPTVMVTGLVDAELEQAAREAGCVDFLAKQDLSPERLADIVKTIAVRAGSEDRAEAEAASEELTLLLEEVIHTSGIERARPLISRMVSLISEMRREVSPETPEPLLHQIDELSELSLLLWIETDDTGDPGLARTGWPKV